MRTFEIVQCRNKTLEVTKRVKIQAKDVDKARVEAIKVMSKPNHFIGAQSI